MRKLLHFPLVLMNRLNETESDVFLYYSFSIFLKDPFFQIIKFTLCFNLLSKLCPSMSNVKFIQVLFEKKHD